MALEIGDQDRPRRLYSPIRADLWSCGLMLRYLARKGDVKEENSLEVLTKQLLNKFPRLHALSYLRSSITVGHLLVELQLD